jgi:hypothetical protein
MPSLLSFLEINIWKRGRSHALGTKYCSKAGINRPIWSAVLIKQLSLQYFIYSVSNQSNNYHKKFLRLLFVSNNSPHRSKPSSRFSSLAMLRNDWRERKHSVILDSALSRIETLASRTETLTHLRLNNHWQSPVLDDFLAYRKLGQVLTLSNFTSICLLHNNLFAGN